MSWYTPITETASSAFAYINENEWAANALAGAAGAGLQYLVAKDEQDFRRKEADRAWNRKLELTKTPTVDADKYDWSDLANGGLTDGGLLSQASKE